MSVLIVGGDKIDDIKKELEKLGADRFMHFSGRKLKSLKNVISKRIDLMVILTDCVNNDLMESYKNTARTRNLPFICTQSVSHFRCCFESIKNIFV